MIGKNELERDKKIPSGTKKIKIVSTGRAPSVTSTRSLSGNQAFRSTAQTRHIPIPISAGNRLFQKSTPRRTQVVNQPFQKTPVTAPRNIQTQRQNPSVYSISSSITPNYRDTVGGIPGALSRDQQQFQHVTNQQQFPPLHLLPESTSSTVISDRRGYSLPEDYEPNQVLERQSRQARRDVYGEEHYKRQQEAQWMKDQLQELKEKLQQKKQADYMKIHGDGNHIAKKWLREKLQSDIIKLKQQIEDKNKKEYTEDELRERLRGLGNEAPRAPTPVQRAATPVQRAATPVQRAVTPAKRPASPVQRAASPRARSRSQTPKPPQRAPSVRQPVQNSSEPDQLAEQQMLQYMLDTESFNKDPNASRISTQPIRSQQYPSILSDPYQSSFEQSYAPYAPTVNSFNSQRFSPAERSFVRRAVSPRLQIAPQGKKPLRLQRRTNLEEQPNLTDDERKIIEFRNFNHPLHDPKGYLPVEMHQEIQDYVDRGPAPIPEGYRQWNDDAIQQDKIKQAEALIDKRLQGKQMMAKAQKKLETIKKQKGQYIKKTKKTLEQRKIDDAKKLDLKKKKLQTYETENAKIKGDHSKPSVYEPKRLHQRFGLQQPEPNQHDDGEDTETSQYEMKWE